jgi:cytoplasmic iron level regulating protein YaaA (DUF328/UPF0246 family)
MLLAPSKTMDFESPITISIPTKKPIFADDAEVIALTIKRMSMAEIAKDMHVSDVIAARVKDSYGNWKVAAAGRPALWTYKGDVYKGMYSHTLSLADAEWAQQHLLISSGLYGLVRPYDGILPYRLEMKAKIPVKDTKDIPSFWGQKLSDYIAERGIEWLCNLSSDEYSRPALKDLPKTIRIITPVFYDNRPNGTVGTAPIYNKMMRGVIARWMIDHRIERPEQLQAFTGHGYYYDESRSTLERPAFFREKMIPLVF